ncbi:response regulator [Caballeronia sp. LZ016]|uniref:response regulator n=1 Tax=Caballeronia sp. LZ016 TaxID=3038554 RepID=UPI0028643C10|nr:response regulator [Caballeronia sp. LZ016]MDR5740138.1 response regulator [Caballeronia sp. LZ016]
MTTIVVVDDEQAITDFLCYLFQEEGFVVSSASDGKSALELIRSVRPSLVVTDFMMPIMSGLELAQALRGCEDSAGIPIILATAAQGAIARAHATLFNAILDKPYPPDELLRLANSLVPSVTGHRSFSGNDNNTS